MIAFAAWAGGLGNGKKACFGNMEFPLKPFHDLLFHPHHFSVGDHLPMKGPDPQNSPHS